jgi:hypothetical protein
MKSKLVLLALTGALALSASAPNVMAIQSAGNHAARRQATANPQPRVVVKKDASKRLGQSNARSNHAAK